LLFFVESFPNNNLTEQEIVFQSIINEVSHG